MGVVYNILADGANRFQMFALGTHPICIPHIPIVGIPFAALTEREVVRLILSQLDAGTGGWVVTPNVDILRQITNDPGARKVIEGSTILVPDGMPLIWASHVRGTPLPQRVAGSTLIRTLSAKAAQRGRSVFLVGGAETAAETAARKLADEYTGLHVAGAYCPPHGFESNCNEMEQLKSALLDAAPDIVYVGLGFPKQERLILQLRPLLPRAWWIGVGISFSYIAGLIRQAPVWMRRMGLEWSFRLVQEPRRLFMRYIIRDIPFTIYLIGHSAIQRVLIRTGGKSGYSS